MLESARVEGRRALVGGRRLGQGFQHVERVGELAQNRLAAAAGGIAQAPRHAVIQARQRRERTGRIARIAQAGADPVRVQQSAQHRQWAAGLQRAEQALEHTRRGLRPGRRLQGHRAAGLAVAVGHRHLEAEHGGLLEQWQGDPGVAGVGVVDRQRRRAVIPLRPAVLQRMVVRVRGHRQQPCGFAATGDARVGVGVVDTRGRVGRCRQDGNGDPVAGAPALIVHGGQRQLDVRGLGHRRRGERHLELVVALQRQGGAARRRPPQHADHGAIVTGGAVQHHPIAGGDGAVLAGIHRRQGVVEGIHHGDGDRIPAHGATGILRLQFERQRRVGVHLRRDDTQQILVPGAVDDRFGPAGLPPAQAPQGAARGHRGAAVELQGFALIDPLVLAGVHAGRIAFVGVDGHRAHRVAGGAAVIGDPHPDPGFAVHRRGRHPHRQAARLLLDHGQRPIHGPGHRHDLAVVVLGGEPKGTLRAGGQPGRPFQRRPRRPVGRLGRRRVTVRATPTPTTGRQQRGDEKHRRHAKPVRPT